MKEPRYFLVNLAGTNMFRVGDTVEIGKWPRWFYRFYVPMWARKAMQSICVKFGKKIGPQYTTITKVYTNESKLF